VRNPLRTRKAWRARFNAWMMILLKNSHIWWKAKTGIIDNPFRDYISAIVQGIRTTRSNFSQSFTNPIGSAIIFHALIPGDSRKRCRSCKKSCRLICNIC